MRVKWIEEVLRSPWLKGPLRMTREESLRNALLLRGLTVEGLSVGLPEGLVVGLKVGVRVGACQKRTPITGV